MKLQVAITPEDASDQIEITAYFLDRDRSVSERFATSLLETYSLLSSARDLGTRHVFKNLQLTAVRLWPVQHFPRYIVFYQQTAAELKILRILHSSRDWATILES